MQFLINISSFLYMDISNVWKNRDEEFIHQCLEEAFEFQSYKVRNLHKSDRSHENGVDLECTNPDEKVAIQAKIKPSKPDIEQLQKDNNLSDKENVSQPLAAHE